MPLATGQIYILFRIIEGLGKSKYIHKFTESNKGNKIYLANDGKKTQDGWLTAAFALCYNDSMHFSTTNSQPLPALLAATNKNKKTSWGRRFKFKAQT